MIYFISDGEFVKVGKATNSRRRMADHQVANARKLKLLAEIEGSFDLERRIHKILPNRANGEWFGPSDVLSSLLDGLSEAPDAVAFVEAFVSKRLHEKRAFINRFKGQWEHLDAEWKGRVKLLYLAAVAVHGREHVASATGVTPNMVRLIVRGKAIPSAMPWLRFQREFDVRSLLDGVNALIVKAERIAA